MSRKRKRQITENKTIPEKPLNPQTPYSVISLTDKPWWKKGNLQLLFSAFLLLLLVGITYKDAIKNNFVDWDDYAYVVNNDLVRSSNGNVIKEIFTTQVSSNYHPLTILSLRANNNVCKTCPDGISAAPFIRWNIIIHILNTLLVLVLVYLLFNRNIIIALITAAIFGVHPMHVESVAWISERKDVLYSFFFLSGIIAYLIHWKSSHYKIPWLILSFILFVLSCLSKAMAVVFPVVLILINFWLYHTEEDKPVLKAFKNAVSWKNLTSLIPFFVVSVFTGLMAFRVQSGKNFLGLLDLTKNIPDVVNKIGPFSVLQRFEVASYGFIIYIIKFFVPVNLSALYPYPAVQDFSRGSFQILLILSLITVLIIAFFVFRSLKRTKIYLFGIGFYFITIALVLQFITVGMAIVAERYSYLPYIGLAIIPASLIGSTKKWHNIFLVIAGCFVIVLMILSQQRISVWQNSETLWTPVIEKHPHIETPRKCRGKYYSKRSFLAKTANEKKIFENKALADYAEAIKSGTHSVDVFQGAGIIYGFRGDFKNAIQSFGKALSLDPKKGSTYYNRALIYDQMNQKELSIMDYNMALIYSPQMAGEILNNRSNLLLETGRYKEAIADLDYLLTIHGNNYIYYSNRAFAKFRTNDIKGAINDYQTALKIKPDDQFSRNQLQDILKNQR